MSMHLFLVIAGSISLSIPSHATLDTTLTKEVLAPGVYLFRAPRDLDWWAATNSVVIVNDQDVTVFDSHSRPKTARMVIAEIRKLTDKPVRWLINSHWHLDHWTGNAEYVKAYPGVQIIATTRMRDYMRFVTPHYFATAAGGGVAGAEARLDSAIRTGKLRDGSPLTAERRHAIESNIQATKDFAAEMEATPRVLPTVVYRDTMIFWSGDREFRLFSMQGDAPATTVLYLPAERVVVTGDVVIAPDDGDGPPPWSLAAYAALPTRLSDLRALQALDVNVIVPGHGPAFHDKTYLSNTVDLYAGVLSQVHAAIDHGAVHFSDIRKAVNVDAIGKRFTRDGSLPGYFSDWVDEVTRKACQEAFDTHVIE
jgi:cyclase